MAVIGSKDDPSTPSAAHRAMEPYWKMVSAIVRGVRGMRAGGEEYLPRFEAESDAIYKRRLDTARMTNVFTDIVSNLAMRPFQQPVQLGEDTPEALEEYAEDVDGRGTHLSVFSAMLFRHALEDGLTWVLVDHTMGIPEGASIAEEREMGARPFWVEYRAADVLAAYSDRVDGEERFLEVRLREDSVERDGFEEKAIERIRIFRHDPGSPVEWEIWRKKETLGIAVNKDILGAEWELEDGPNILAGVESIPIVPVLFGLRHGGSWYIDPPLRDAAYLQIELYQQENALKNIRNFTAFPMLAANGMDPILGEDNSPAEIVTGPHAVLYGGTSESGGGTWTFIEPSGASLNFLREDIKDTIRELRELGRQPLTAQSNLTVITSAAVAQKTNSAIQAWARMLGNALSNAFALTAEWLNLDETDAVEVRVHDDFDLGIDGDATFADVLAMGTGPEPLISRDAVLEEAKRRSILRPDYDPEADLELVDRRVEDDLPAMMPALEIREEIENDLEDS